MYRISTTLLSISLAAAAGCNFAPPQEAIPPKSPEAPIHCEGRMISVEEAQRLIEGCRVVSLGQPHEGPVILYLREGTRTCFYQPHIDWVIAKAAQACPASPVQMVVE